MFSNDILRMCELFLLPMLSITDFYKRTNNYNCSQLHFIIILFFYCSPLEELPFIKILNFITT